MASTAVRAAMHLKADLIIVFTVGGQTPRLISKYRPNMPILSVLNNVMSISLISEICGIGGLSKIVK